MYWYPLNTLLIHRSENENGATEKCEEHWIVINTEPFDTVYCICEEI